MLHLSFIYPEMLWFLLLLLPLWGVALFSHHRVSRLRFWLGTSLRTLLLLVLVFSLAGTQLVSPVDALTTVFLIDSSDSVAPSARGQAEAFVQQAIDAMPEGDRAGLIIFGKDALVEHIPSESRVLGKLTSTPTASHTSIEAAIQLGLALLPTETQKRLVLLTDGGENIGQAMAAARLAAARNIPIDVVDLSGIVAGDEVLISDFQAPNHIRDGQEVNLSVTIESNREQDVLLHLFDEQNLLVEQTVHLKPGNTVLQFPVVVRGTGFHRYRARIEPAQDGRVQNNEAAVMVQVQGAPRVLLVEGTPGESVALSRALAAAQITADTVAPADMPINLSALSSYEAVVLVNVPSRALPAEAMTTLPSYVRDLGRGLVMIGGTESYGVGGYGHTPIEDALPVYMDVRSKEERPNLGLVFVIDKSGSMDSCHCSGTSGSTGMMQQGGVRKVDIAKEAVIQASSLLGAQDILGIVAFDNEAHQIYPPTQGPATTDVVDAVSPMQPWGSTNVGAGLLAAEQMLATTDARIKHVILLTDGWGGDATNLNGIAARMKEQGITLSVVAAGSGSADTLETLAMVGGGRYYPARDMSEVPEIFLQETIFASGNYLVEGAFIPATATDSAILHGIEGFPTLYGYNGTTLKETARPILVSAEQSPVLAVWNYGLGRSAAWTSDMKGKWGHDLVQWGQFPQFAAQLVNWVFPTITSEQMASEVRGEGSQITIQTTLEDEEGKPREQATVEAVLVESRGKAGQDDTPARTLPLVQVAPGEYRATEPAPAPGTYLVQIVAREEDQVVAQETAALVVPYSPEYRQDQSNPALLEELTRLTGGTYLKSPAQAFVHNQVSVTRAQEIALPLLIMALLLLPCDIAVRRLSLAQPLFKGVTARVRRRTQSGQPSGIGVPNGSPPPPPPPPDPNDPMERLRAAKERARRRVRGDE